MAVVADDPKPFVASDFGTDALIQHWRRRREQQFASAVASASGRSEVIAISESIEAKLTGQVPIVLISLPEILVGAVLVEKGDKHPDGDIIIAVNNVYFQSLEQFNRIVQQQQPGGIVALLVRRGDAALYIPIRVGGDGRK